MSILKWDENKLATVKGKATDGVMEIYMYMCIAKLKLNAPNFEKHT